MNIGTLPITMRLVDQFVGYNQLRNKGGNIYPTSSSNGTFVVLNGTFVLLWFFVALNGTLWYLMVLL